MSAPRGDPVDAAWAARAVMLSLHGGGRRRFCGSPVQSERLPRRGHVSTGQQRSGGLLRCWHAPGGEPGAGMSLALPDTSDNRPLLEQGAMHV